MSDLPQTLSEWRRFARGFAAAEAVLVAAVEGEALARELSGEIEKKRQTLTNLERQIAESTAAMEALGIQAEGAHAERIARLQDLHDQRRAELETETGRLQVQHDALQISHAIAVADHEASMATRTAELEGVTQKLAVAKAAHAEFLKTVGVG